MECYPIAPGWKYQSGLTPNVPVKVLTATDDEVFFILQMNGVQDTSYHLEIREAGEVPIIIRRTNSIVAGTKHFYRNGLLKKSQSLYIVCNDASAINYHIKHIKRGTV